MLGIDSSELLLVALVALVVIGPKDLPKAMRVVGYWVGKARGVARQFRQGFDTMVREAELEDMEKRWAEENARIMREHPAPAETAVPADGSAEPAAGSVAHAEADAGDAAPLMVEKPVVAPAAQDRPTPHADSMPS